MSTLHSSRWIARCWLYGLALCVVLMLPALGWSFLTPAPYGDLTRIGRFSEEAFGWRARQPTIALPRLHRSALQDADVLVIGDSFSASLQWQSVLVAAGWRVATLAWSDVGPLCSDFEPWLRRQGYRGRLVILQKVERSLPALLRDSAGCQHMPAHSTAAGRAPTVSVPLTDPPAFAYNTQAALDTGIVTRWRTWRAEREAAGFVARDAERVRVQSVPGGCALFSHRLCERGLFLADDLDLPAVTAQDIATLPGLLADTPTLQLLWAVMPNKTTVYLQPERARRLSAAMQSAVVAPGRGVDLFGALPAQRDRQTDLYFPNDTHLSTAGYLFVGQLLAQAVGPPPAR